MKRFLSVTLILFAFIFCTNGVAQAIEPETKDVVKKSLDITEGFDKPLRAGNEEYARKFSEDCRNAYNELYDYLKANQKTEANGNVTEFLPRTDRDCIYYAATVVVMRLYALTDYLLAAEAYKNGQYRIQRKMNKLCTNDWSKANEYRQGFKTTYGY